MAPTPMVTPGQMVTRASSQTLSHILTGFGIMPPHFRWLMIAAIQLGGKLQRLLRESVERLVKFAVGGNVLRFRHRLSEFADRHHTG